MKINNTLIFTIVFCASMITILATEPVRTNDTSNVGHQFYDALIKTPAEAFSNVGQATHDVASAVANSDASQKLKTAGKQLAIEAPVKEGYAIKNGVVKAAHATANGARTAYDVTILKPAHAVGEAAEQAINSDFVQGTKEAAMELGEQFKDAGLQVKDATVYGAKKVYHVLIRKPVGAIKAAANYLDHSEDDELHASNACGHPEHCVQANGQIYVAIVPKANDQIDESGRTQTTHINNEKPYVNGETAAPCAHTHDVILQFEIETSQPIDLSKEPLSHSTMDKVTTAFNAIKQDLSSQ